MESPPGHYFCANLQTRETVSTGKACVTEIKPLRKGSRHLVAVGFVRATAAAMFCGSILHASRETSWPPRPPCGNWRFCSESPPKRPPPAICPAGISWPIAPVFPLYESVTSAMMLQA